MLELNIETQKQLIAKLEETKTPHYQHRYCLRWLKYYLDFCHHDAREPLSKSSASAYIQKLKQIKRSKFQQDQAWMVIQLFQEMPIQRPINAQPIAKVEPNAQLWQQAIHNMRQEIQVRHYSPKTLKSYTHWAARFVKFVPEKSPNKVTTNDAKNYLTYLAVQTQVSAATQNQALNALSFFFQHGLKRKLGRLKMVRAKDKRRIPIVLTPEEIHAICKQLAPPYQLIVCLLYGCGLRLAECLNLRIQDIDFEQGLILVHRGKGGKDRTVPLPLTLVSELKVHLESVCSQHQQDLIQNYNGAFMHSNNPNLEKQSMHWRWQWVFPSKQLTPIEGKRKRAHLHATHVQRAIKSAVEKAGINKKASAHTFRHSFASHLLQANVDIKTIQELLGHSNLKTTLIYTHTVKSQTTKEKISPLDLCPLTPNP